VKRQKQSSERDGKILPGPRILLTNDDGLHASGLNALRESLDELGEISIVAPARDHSGVSHSITYLHPVHCRAVIEAEGIPAYVVDGTPADCVKLAILELLPEKPDLLVSGMNLGLNVGVSTFYSGTLAAAVEGAMFGVRSMAVSMEVLEPSDFATAGEIAAEVAETVMLENLPPKVILNLNIPSASRRTSRELRITRLGVEFVGEYFEKRGRIGDEDAYQIAVHMSNLPEDADTDVAAVMEGCISLTPILLDTTAYGAISSLEKIQFIGHPDFGKKTGRIRKGAK